MSADERRERVALIGPHPPYRGGIAHFTERLGAHLTEAGLSVFPVSFSRLYPDLLFPGQSQYEEGSVAREGPECLIDSINPLSWRKTARTIVSDGADAAIFMYWMPFFAPAMRSIAGYLRAKGVGTIAVVHNAVPHERHPGDKKLSRAFLRKCDVAIVLSKNVGNDVKELVPEARICFAPHPVYDQFGARIDGATARRMIGLREDHKVLLFFGMIRRYKGLHVLIDAFPRVMNLFPEARLVVAGEFYDDVESYRAQIESLGISDYVILTEEYVPSDRVAVYFSAADVVVQPYLRATQSGVVQAAFNFEKPVIVTDVGGLAEIVGDTSAGIVVPPGDDEALTAAILQFFSEDMRPTLEEGVRRARSLSTWTKYVDIIRGELKRD